MKRRVVRLHLTEGDSDVGATLSIQEGELQLILPHSLT